MADVRCQDSRLPVIQNGNAAAETESATLKANLLKQLYSPVLWTDSVRALVSNDVEVAVECGTGKVLAGLAKRIDRALAVHSIEEPDSLAKTLEACLQVAMAGDGLEGLVRGFDTGAVVTHFVDTTEPSPLSHEILNSRP
mgnify:CR=1 FL=1